MDCVDVVRDRARIHDRIEPRETSARATWETPESIYIATKREEGCCQGQSRFGVDHFERLHPLQELGKAQESRQGEAAGARGVNTGARVVVRWRRDDRCQE